jgi:hypothetical protein
MSFIVTSNFPPLTALNITALTNGETFRIEGIGARSVDFYELTTALEEKYGMGTSIGLDTDSWTETWTNETCEIKAWQNKKLNQSGIDYIDLPRSRE